MQTGLSGKAVVVTGAAMGIGREISAAFVQNGSRVIGVDVADVQELVAEAKQSGATVNEVGRIADETLFRKGYFHRPTIITDADPRLRVVQEEQFGPLIPILPFDKEEEAIRMANETEYGLCSSVWTADKDRALSIARRLEAGYTYLNGHGPMAQDSRAPFGGFKESGIGRALGFEGVAEFMEYHSISGSKGELF